MIAPGYCRQQDESGVVSVPPDNFTIYLSTSVAQSHLMFVILQEIESPGYPHKCTHPDNFHFALHFPEHCHNYHVVSSPVFTVGEVAQRDNILPLQLLQLMCHCSLFQLSCFAFLRTIYTSTTPHYRGLVTPQDQPVLLTQFPLPQLFQTSEIF